MIAKITVGAGFNGSLSYDRDQGQRDGKVVTLLYAEGVDMNYDATGKMDPDYKEIARSFRMQANLNPKVSKPVVHIVLTFSPKDKPRLNDGYMVSIAKEYLEKMGFKDTQYIIHRHSETNNPHVHITVNRVDNSGHRISDKNEWDRSTDVCKEITLREGLTWGESKTLSKCKVNDPVERLRYDMARDIHECVGRIRNINQLPEETAKYGIETRFRRNPNTGAITGVSFARKDGNGEMHVFKGSDIDRTLSAGNIMKELGSGMSFSLVEPEHEEQKSDTAAREKLEMGLEAGFSILGGGGEGAKKDEQELNKKRGRGMGM